MGQRSFIWDVCCHTPLATYPETRTDSPQSFPYLVLHRTGFTKLSRSPGKLVRSYRTVSPLPRCLAASRRSTLCCTFLHVTVTPRYGASCPVVFGLSSRRGNPPSDRLFRSDRNLTFFRSIEACCTGGMKLIHSPAGPQCTSGAECS